MFRRKQGPLCPFMQRTCMENECRMWVKVDGRDPQSAEPIERWDCSFALAPLLQIEIARVTGGVQDAVVSHRNEHVTRMDKALDQRMTHELERLDAHKD